MAGTKGNEPVQEDMVRHMILNSIRAINNKFGKIYGRMVVCTDGGNLWRKTQFPYYKASRKKNKDGPIDWQALYATLNKVRVELQENFTYPVIHVSSFEADDIIAILSRESKEEVLIVSGDKDFIQLHSNKVKQYDNVKGIFITSNDVKRFTFDHIMKGDVGDGIPNVLSDDDTFVVDGKRQKPLTTKKLDEWYSQIDNPSGWIGSIRTNFNRNRKLIDLSIHNEKQKNIILEAFDVELNKKVTTSLITYFMKHKLSVLMERVNDFKEKQYQVDPLENFT